jgi:TPR repeat protein
LSRGQIAGILTGMPHQVFVSYSTKDKIAADVVVARLEREALSCWYAPRDIVPGSSWATSIVNAIAGCKVMVVVFSQNANKSDHISREVERAVGHGVPVVPLRIEDVMPQGDLEYFLSSSHWMDAITPPVERHLDELSHKLKSLLEPGEAAVQARGPATQARIARRWPRYAAWGLGAAACIIIVALCFALRRTPRGPQPNVGVLSSPTQPAAGNAVSGDPVVAREYAEFKEAASITWDNSFFVDRAPKRYADWLQLAERGDAVAEFFVGVSQEQGVGTRLDKKAGCDWLQKAAAQGNVDAMCALGECFYSGDGVATDPAQGYRWLTDAADAGHVPAMALLAGHWDKFRPTTGPADVNEILNNRWLRKACDAGNADAQYFLVEMQFLLSGGVAAAVSRHTDEIRRVAKSGHPLALLYAAEEEPDRVKSRDMFTRALHAMGSPAKVARITHHGYLDLLNPPNVFPDATLDRLKEMAAAGSAAAMQELADLFYDGRAPYPENKPEAARWYLKAYDAGGTVDFGKIGDIYARPGAGRDMPAAVTWWSKAGDGYWEKVGDAYAAGDGLGKDMATAISWWSKAESYWKVADAYAKGDGIERDVPQAIAAWEKVGGFWQIGDLYANGTGVEKNNNEALKWYVRAAEKEDDSKCALANLYLQGSIVPKDIDKAVSWYQRAADDGYVTAMTWIGSFYRDGIGQTQDPAKAIHWFLLGSLKGYGDDAAMKCLAGMLGAGAGVTRDEAAAHDFDPPGAGTRDAASKVKIGAEAANIGLAANADPLWKSLAAFWYWSAGCDGNPTAMREYAKLLDQGIDIAGNGPITHSSDNWWAQAADKGDLEALKHLGRTK